MGDYVTITTGEGALQAYVSKPELPVAPTIVVLHEVFGVNSDLRQTCDDLAREGYIAICPDLFWRLSPGIDLSVNSVSDWNVGLALYRAYDREAGVRDILAVVKFSGAMSGASGKVGVLGYCLGGLMAFLVAARGNVDTAVTFHGADTEKYLDEVSAITAPMLMHLAGADEFIPPAAQEAIESACAAQPNIKVFTYKGCHHAFSRHGGAHYDAGAAAMANNRNFSFLKAHLT